ncbi:TPA_asm: maturation protein [ssRNA phage Gerhypos.3_27]|uniref:Maturation protein n=2 Tax=Norzivirales TaxID=2842247 RepID=A0A8S5KYR8_9VIRU|nr:maturation protein [ssRNA phage Gerhypos.3_27]QDH87992.1 MAG: hypothetical protein H3Bulk42499_000001 [Leviviridae sp.]DAD50189.1 TPA_asm: maturation protein [ssRNA phage Gerhypos.3_27]
MVLAAYSQNKPGTFTAYSSAVINNDRYGSSNVETSQAYPIGDTLSGFKNSSYKEQIARSENATTPMSALSKQVQLMVPLEFNFTINRPGNDDDTVSGKYEQFVTFGSPDANLLSTVNNAALSRLYQNLNSNFKGLTVLGEIGETLAMIRQPAVGLRKGIDEYRRRASAIRRRFSRSNNGWRDYRKALAELWLEYSFGWKPLLVDIQAGYDAFRDRADRSEYTNFRASASDRRVSPRGFVANLGGMPAVIHVEAFAEYEAGVVYIGKSRVKPEVKSGFLTSTNWPDFIPAAWELAPWSFLIDYFVNIGDVLECWASAQLHDITVSSCSSRSLCTTTADATISGYIYQLPNYQSWSESPGTCVTIVKAVERSIPTLSLPKLEVSTRFTAPRALNIAALLALRKSDANFRTRD